MSSHERIPWSNHRQLLWLVGVLGLVAASAGSVIHWLFAGFQIGGPPPGSHLEDWIFLIVVGNVSGYYIALAHWGWSRRLWLVGVVVHSIFLLMLLVGLLLTRGGGAVALPLLLAGPTIWVLYMRRQRKAHDAV
jgi:hypothetical protein